MSDIYDDIVALRAAGYYQAGADDPDDRMTWAAQAGAELAELTAGLEELGERVSALSHGHAELLNQRNHWQAAYNCLRGSVPWDEIAICADIADAVHTPEAGAVIAWLASHQPKEAQP